MNSYEHIYVPLLNFLCYFQHKEHKTHSFGRFSLFLPGENTFLSQKKEKCLMSPHLVILFLQNPQRDADYQWRYSLSRVKLPRQITHFSCYLPEIKREEICARGCFFSILFGWYMKGLFFPLKITQIRFWPGKEGKIAIGTVARTKFDTTPTAILLPVARCQNPMGFFIVRPLLKYGHPREHHGKNPVKPSLFVRQRRFVGGFEPI